MSEEEAVSTLAAAYVYVYARSGKFTMPKEPTTIEQMVAWGKTHMPNGDARPQIDEALRTLFGPDAPKLRRK